MMILSALLAGCGKARPSAHPSALPDRTGLLADGQTLEFDATVAPQQQELLAGDIARIHELQWPDPEGRLADALGIDRATGQTLERWLRRRVRFVVGETFDSRFWFQGGLTYQPVLLNDVTQLGRRELEPAVLMSNVGASLYVYGKANGSLVGTRVVGRDIWVSSPRVGILQVGPSLFGSPRASEPAPPSDRAARELTDSLIRIGVLFHEARHDDGHGANTGFPHEVCPPDHGPEGKRACDAHGNGAYAIELQVLRSLRAACRDCPRQETERLDGRISELMFRILPGANESRPDPRPERIQ